MSVEKNNKGLPYIEGWFSIGINIALFILKYIVGTLSGSIAIIADAWHSLSDSLTSVIVIIGAKISEKPPDEEHPFGHERITLIASIIIGVLLFVVALGFLNEAIRKLLYKKSASYTSITLIAIFISFILKEGLARYAIFAYKKTGLEMLKADAWHHRSDALSSLVIIIGILIGRSLWWIDGVLGIIISIMIIHASYEVFKNSINPILGVSPDDELINSIKNILDELSDIGDLYVHHFHLHSYGTHKELTFHIMFPKEMSIEKCHKIATDIEKKIKKELNINATIHLESQ